MSAWLFKTEPESFSLADLQAAPRQTTYWDGVRNYQARNYLRDSIAVGDQVLFYHSSVDQPAIVGTAVVVKAGYPDFTAWDPQSNHFDEDASPEKPIWQMVDIRFESEFARPLLLKELRAVPRLAGMELLRRGSRLSVQPVSEANYELILSLAGTPIATKSVKLSSSVKTQQKPTVKKKRATERVKTSMSKTGKKSATKKTKQPKTKTAVEKKTQKA